MLGEFFTCPADAIDLELLTVGPHKRFPTVEANGLTPVNLATLGVLLDAGSYSELLAQTSTGHRESETGTSGVLTVPPSLCASLSHAEIDAVAARWALTDELRLSRWSTESAAHVLHGLAELAASAETPVWYWWSV